MIKKKAYSNKVKASKNKLRVIKTTQEILSNYHISLVMASKENECSAVYYKGKRTKISSSTAWHFENTRCFWNIICGLICRDQQGKHYIEYVSFGSTTECTIDMLSELTFTTCKQLFDKGNKLHKLCPFYIARPIKEVDLSLILQTIHHYEILNRIGTNFEINVNKPFVDYHELDNWLKVIEEIQFKELDLEFYDEKD